MKDNKCYKVQLVGNLDTVKRMVASLFLVDAKKERQTLKVSEVKHNFLLQYLAGKLVIKAKFPFMLSLETIIKVLGAFLDMSIFRT